MKRRYAGGCLSTIIFIVALALAAVLIIAMLSRSDRGEDSILGRVLHTIGIKNDRDTEDPETETAVPVPVLPKESYTETETGRPDDDTPEPELVISSDSTVTVTGSAERDKFIEAVQAQENSGIGSLELMMLKMAPEELEFKAKVAVAYDASVGQVSMTPKSLSVAGITVPTAVLPSSVTDSLNTAMTDFFASYGRQPAGLTLYDGYLVVYFD